MQISLHEKNKNKNNTKQKQKERDLSPPGRMKRLFKTFSVFSGLSIYSSLI